MKLMKRKSFEFSGNVLEHKVNNLEEKNTSMEETITEIRL